MGHEVVMDAQIQAAEKSESEVSKQPRVKEVMVHVQQDNGCDKNTTGTKNPRNFPQHFPRVRNMFQHGNGKDGAEKSRLKG